MKGKTANRGTLFPGHVTGRLPTLVRGEGIYVWDDSGQRYLDGAAGIGVVNIGYGRREVAEALAQQAVTLPYCAPNLFRNDRAIELAAKLREFTPAGLNHAYFVSGGSEAVEVAIKMARQYHVARGDTARHKVIARWTSYHGATLGALSVTGHIGRREKFKPLLLDVPHIPPPYCGRCHYGLTYPNCRLRCAYALEEAILAEGPETVAAFIMEPIIGSTAGCVIPPDDYLSTVRQICDRHGILLIADEVISGCGRTGRAFAVDHWNTVPDILTVAKGISGGYAPLGAAIAHDRVAGALAQAGHAFDHVFTYASNPLAMAAGLAVLDIVQREDLIRRAAERGRYFLAQAERLYAHRIVGEVRGKGLMLGIEFVQHRASMAPFAPELNVWQQIVDAALRHGLIVYPGHGAIDGVRGDHISLYPPLIISEAELDELLDRLDAAIGDMAATLP